MGSMYSIMKKIIWTSDIDLEGWVDELRTEHSEGIFFTEYESFEDIPEHSLYERIDVLNDQNLQDEKMNLDIPLDSSLIIYAELGLWNGKHYGVKVINDCNLTEIFARSEDRPTWYVDDDNNVLCEDVHHDGTNYYLYRMLKKGITEDDFQSGLEDVADVKDLKPYVLKSTEPLGPMVSKVYGW